MNVINLGPKLVQGGAIGDEAVKPTKLKQEGPECL